MRPRAQVPQGPRTSGLGLRLLWLSPAPARGDDLPQVLDLAAPVVLRGAPHDEHSLRSVGQALGARAWRDLQDRVADGESDPQQAHDARSATALRLRRG